MSRSNCLDRPTPRIEIDMPQAVPSVSPLAILVMMAILTWIVSTWIGAALRFAFGQPLLPPKTPRIVPWGAGSVLAAVLVWFATTTLASAGYSLANPEKVAQAKANDGQPPAADMMILTTLYNGATLLLVPLTLAVTAGARQRDFGLEGPGLGEKAVWGILAYPILAPVVFSVMLLSISIWKPTSHPLQMVIQEHPSPGLAALMILAGVVLAPAAEELIFRGVLLGWLSRFALRRNVDAQAKSSDPDFPSDPMIHLDIPEDQLDVSESSLDPGQEIGPEPDPWGGPSVETPTASSRQPMLLLANVLVSLVFASLHGAVWPTPIPIFFLSMGLGFLYQRTGGLVAPIALHMTFNGISTLVMFLTAGVNAPGGPQKPVPLPVPAGVSANQPVWLPVELRLWDDPKLRLIEPETFAKLYLMTQSQFWDDLVLEHNDLRSLPSLTCHIPVPIHVPQEWTRGSSTSIRCAQDRSTGLPFLNSWTYFDGADGHGIFLN